MGKGKGGGVHSISWIKPPPRPEMPLFAPFIFILSLSVRTHSPWCTVVAVQIQAGGPRGRAIFQLHHGFIDCP